MDYDNPLNKSITNTKYYNKNEYPYLMDNKHLKSVQLIETPLNINWNYRDFPFDKQKLIYRYTTTVDTSIMGFTMAPIVFLVQVEKSQHVLHVGCVCVCMCAFFNLTK